MCHKIRCDEESHCRWLIVPSSPGALLSLLAGHSKDVHARWSCQSSTPAALATCELVLVEPGIPAFHWSPQGLPHPWPNFFFALTSTVQVYMYRPGRKYVRVEKSWQIHASRTRSLHSIGTSSCARPAWTSLEHYAWWYRQSMRCDAMRCDAMGIYYPQRRVNTYDERLFREALYRTYVPQSRETRRARQRPISFWGREQLACTGKARMRTRRARPWTDCPRHATPRRPLPLRCICSRSDPQRWRSLFFFFYFFANKIPSATVRVTTSTRREARRGRHNTNEGPWVHSGLLGSREEKATTHVRRSQSQVLASS